MLVDIHVPAPRPLPPGNARDPRLAQLLGVLEHVGQVGLLERRALRRPREDAELLEFEDSAEIQAAPNVSFS